MHNTRLARGLALALALALASTLLAASGHVNASPNQQGEPDRASSLFRADLNLVVDQTEALQQFYTQLDALRRADRHRLVVLHVGDSHIEAPFFGSAVRAAVAPWVGSIGRGLVVPKYRKRVVTSRKRVRYVSTSLELPQEVKQAEFTLAVRTDDAEGFSRLVFVHEQGPTYLDMTILDPDNRVLATVTASTGVGTGTTVVSLAEAYRSVKVRTARSRPGQKYAQVYGVSLETAGGGVLYHSYGIIGATAGTFAKSATFRTLMASLKPDLVVVSLGTNDAMPLPFDGKAIRSQMAAVVSVVRETIPDSPVLLTTPAGSFRRPSRRRKPVVNSNVADVRRIELDVARQLRCATWDLFEIIGGPGATQAWRDAGLAGKDLVHFSRAGYELQGTRFAEALFRGLKQDVDRRFESSAGRTAVSR